MPISTAWSFRHNEHPASLPVCACPVAKATCNYLPHLPRMVSPSATRTSTTVAVPIFSRTIRLCRMPRQAVAIFCAVSALTLLDAWSGQALVGAGLQDPRLRRNAFILSSPDTGSQCHTHHNPHSHFESGRYTLELSSDPYGLRRAVPGAPVLPCTPAPFRYASAGPRVVRSSTVARSPSVGLITHIFPGRVSRFSCLCSVPGWPVPMSPIPGEP